MRIGTLCCRRRLAASRKEASRQDRPRSSRLIPWLLACAIGFGGALARAADPQPYTVAIAATGDSALDSALESSSQLESLRQSAPVSAFALVGRAREDVTRLKTVLEKEKYALLRCVARAADFQGHKLVVAFAEP